MDKKIYSIGILGVSNISTKSIIEPVNYIEELVVRGIASSNKNRAELFACISDSIYVFDNYEELIKSKDIDIVYIPLANHLHYEWVIKAAYAKKHILVEKPICLNLKQANLIDDAIKKNGVKMLEGIMVQHHSWQNEIKKIVESKVYGKLKSIKTNIFCQLKFSENNYRFNPDMGGGVFWDSAPYWIQFLQDCLNLEVISFEGSSIFNGPNQIDEDFKARIILSNEIVADFHGSYNYPFEASHLLTFEYATISVGNFFRPIFGKAKLIINISSSIGDERKVFPPENYYINQLNYFLQLIKDLKINYSTDYKNRIKILEDIYNYALKNKKKHSTSYN